MRSSVPFVLVAVLLLASACGVGFKGGGLAQPELQPARAFLIRDQPEEKGYGLYSYLLFESPPTKENRQLYLSAIWACVDGIPDIATLVSNHSPDQINLTYVPIIEAAPPPPQARPRREGLHWWSEWILDHYDYARAQLILSRLRNTHLGGGPYLLSTSSPATETSPSSYLFQDLSPIQVVTNPSDRSKLAFEWVFDFIRRASIPQSSAWDLKTLIRFGQDLRASRGNSRLGQQADLNEEKIKRFIINFPDTDDTAFNPRGPFVASNVTRSVNIQDS
jgi:hypothetical protein